MWEGKCLYWPIYIYIIAVFFVKRNQSSWARIFSQNRQRSSWKYPRSKEYRQWWYLWCWPISGMVLGGRRWSRDNGNTWSALLSCGLSSPPCSATCEPLLQTHYAVARHICDLSLFPFSHPCTPTSQIPISWNQNQALNNKDTIYQSCFQQIYSFSDLAWFLAQLYYSKLFFIQLIV